MVDCSISTCPPPTLRQALLTEISRGDSSLRRLAAWPIALSSMLDMADGASARTNESRKGGGGIATTGQSQVDCGGGWRTAVQSKGGGDKQEVKEDIYQFGSHSKCGQYTAGKTHLGPNGPSLWLMTPPSPESRPLGSDFETRPFASFPSCCPLGKLTIAVCARQSGGEGL